MTDAPGSPPAARLSTPSWRDSRLVLGVLLIVVSVLVGAKVLSGADASQQVWVAAHDLAPGTVLTAEDLKLDRVRLFGTSGRYLAGDKPVGYVVQRPIGTDELVARTALSDPGTDLVRREVTVPVPAGHLSPDLDHGDVVDLYVTPSEATSRRLVAAKAAAPYAPQLVLRGVSIARVSRGGGLAASGQDVTVVLSVAPADVAAVVQALADGTLDLVRVPRGSQTPLTTATPAP